MMQFTSQIRSLNSDTSDCICWREGAGFLFNGLQGSSKLHHPHRYLPHMCSGLLNLSSSTKLKYLSYRSGARDPEPKLHSQSYYPRVPQPGLSNSNPWGDWGEAQLRVSLHSSRTNYHYSQILKLKPLSIDCQPSGSRWFFDYKSRCIYNIYMYIYIYILHICTHTYRIIVILV